MEFRIISYKLGTIAEYVKKLNKRAMRLGLEPMAIELFGEDEYEEHYPNEFSLFPILVRFVHIRITGTPPVINGWKLLAILEHTENGNIVRRVPEVADEVNLDAYRTTPRICEHCNKIRPRKDTYVLLHESGETKQVGSQCLKDFLGHVNPEKLAEYAQTWQQIINEMGDESYERYGGNLPREDLDFDTYSYLCCVAAAIREFGWCSGKMAMESYGKTASSIVAADIYNGDKAYKSVKILDADKENATKVLEWTLATTDSNEYMYNLRTVLQGEALNYRRLGLAASAFAAYSKAMEVKVQQEKQVYTPGFINNIGAKIDTIVEVHTCRELDSDFGVTYLYVMSTPDGHLAKWFASRKAMEVGLTYYLHGIVKGHDVYQGKDYTTLTRCKAILKV